MRRQKKTSRITQAQLSSHSMDPELGMSTEIVPKSVAVKAQSHMGPAIKPRKQSQVFPHSFSRSHSNQPTMSQKVDSLGTTNPKPSPRASEPKPTSPTVSAAAPVPRLRVGPKANSKKKRITRQTQKAKVLPKIVIILG